MKHTHTHTYTHTNEITAVQKKKVKESDPASKGSQKLYQPIKRKLTKCKLESNSLLKDLTKPASSQREITATTWKIKTLKQSNENNLNTRIILF